MTKALDVINDLQHDTIGDVWYNSWISILKYRLICIVITKKIAGSAIKASK